MFRLQSSVFRLSLAAASLVMLLLMAVSASAQTSPEKLHEGRVTRSFTEPIETNVVATIEPGVIQRADVKEGDRVSAGDQLAKLNSEVLMQTRRRAVATAKSTAIRDAAKSRSEMLKAQKENLESLVAGGHVNPFELSQKVSEYETAYAEWKSAEDELMLAQIEVDRITAQIEQRVIRSPINGFVTRIHKKLGEQVSNNEPDYATIVRINELKVRFYLDEKTLESIQHRSEVSVLVGENAIPVDARVIYVLSLIHI